MKWHYFFAVCSLLYAGLYLFDGQDRVDMAIALANAAIFYAKHNGSKAA